MRKYFITGTDTNVGKTYISKFICSNFNFDYYKPIQTGAKELKDVDFIMNNTQIKTYESFVFEESCSPHIADKKQIINIKVIKNTIENIKRNLIVEGAGGVMVPISQNYLTLDLMKDLQLPIILVSEDKIGTINHTLLSIEALHKKGLDIKMIILNSKNENEDIILKNYESIAEYSGIKNIFNYSVKGEINFLANIRKLLSF